MMKGVYLKLSLPEKFFMNPGPGRMFDDTLPEIRAALTSRWIGPGQREVYES